MENVINVKQDLRSRCKVFFEKNFHISGKCTRYPCTRGRSGKLENIVKKIVIIGINCLLRYFILELLEKFPFLDCDNHF